MNNLEYSDSALIQEYIKGSEEAFVTLLNRHKNKVFIFIMSKVLDEQVANDIFQETFIKVIQSLKSEKYNDEGKFSAWLMRIAFNCIMDYFRQHSKYTSIFTKDHEEGKFETLFFLNLLEDEHINHDHLTHKIKLLINDLPENQREVIEMRFYRNMSFKDISIFFDVSINTVIGRMRYAIKNIKKNIQDRNMVLSA